jgi:PAS domain S-box-containing protein
MSFRCFKMKKLINYLDPFKYLGVKEYKISFAFVSSIIICILSEIYANLIVKDPQLVGKYVIFINITMIIYFAFRSGINSGLTATFVSLFYYLYIIYSRNYAGTILVSGIQTTIILGFIYAALSVIIGYLKQRIDTLIAKESSEKRLLQYIIDQMPVGIAITDNNGKVTVFNKQLKQLLPNALNKEFVVGKNSISNLYLPNGRSVSPDKLPLAASFASGKPVYKKDFILAEKKHRKLYLQISSILIRNYKNMVVAGVSVVNDATKSKEEEERKDDFVNMVSHELKTPLTSIKLYIELLKKISVDYADKKSKIIVNNIAKQTDKLEELVLNLLDVSRLQTGKLVFKKTEFDICGLVTESVREIQKTSAIHTILFNKKYKKIIINADKFRIGQVITNLLNNAIKYSPDGGNIIVNITTNPKDIIVSVKDPGIGISKNQLRRIFERLYQVPGGIEQTFPGMGMGLYISKEIIKYHKGNIWVESKFGGGSTFCFSLPRIV